mmetsp:Transcript_21636/g.38403  ORF Transcript_21636/g.38403 Transcript_21636/m.38403 type:complete len:339 (+) Transcript_21636:133-1149(+)
MAQGTAFVGRKPAKTICDILMEKEKVKIEQYKKNLMKAQESLKAQMALRKTIKQESKKETVVYAAAEEKMVTAWRAEEAAKLKVKKEKMEKLKKERELQLKEREKRREAIIREKVEYEQKLIDNYKDFHEAEIAKAQKEREERIKAFKAVMLDNEKRKLMKQKQKEKEAKEEMERAKLYNEYVELKERKRAAEIKAREDDHKRRLNKTMAHYVTVQKRDEDYLKTVESYRKKKEAEADLREHQKKEKARVLAAENLKILNKQVKDKQIAKHKATENYDHIKAQYRKIDAQLRIEKAKELQKKKLSQTAYRKMLDEQIKARDQEKKKLASQERPFWLYQ